jgi:S-DNA-T family DNA segregation ATPase FtsK/SpoIIIE
LSPILARRRQQQDHHTVAQFVRYQWRCVCLGAGINQFISNATGGVQVVPEVTNVHIGSGQLVLTVRVLPGQLPSDLSDAAERLAFGMGAEQVRVLPFRADFVRVVLRDHDTLAGVVANVKPVSSALLPITLGTDEIGEAVLLDLSSAAHLIVQGATGGGKSMGMYSMLAQLAEAPDIRITGVDPTGLLLRPWANRWRDIPSPALGTATPFGYLSTLDKVVAEMDRRISTMPVGRDSVELGPGCPVILVVLEEHPGALRILDTQDAAVARTYRALVSRLLAEGRKAGVRVVLLTQRADAAIVGAYERGQASHRISYRIDSTEGLKMLHPDISPEHAAAHSSSLPGVALATMPGRPLLRLRSPKLLYADYCAAIGPPAQRTAGRTKLTVLSGRSK